MVLKELIFNWFLQLGMHVMVLKELIFNKFVLWEQCGGLERIEF